MRRDAVLGSGQHIARDKRHEVVDRDALRGLTAQLAVSLEPVYAIVLAILLLGEQRELTATFYLGVAVILGSVFGHTWLKLRGAP